jgi:hypothetical protein
MLVFCARDSPLIVATTVGVVTFVGVTVTLGSFPITLVDIILSIFVKQFYRRRGRNRSRRVYQSRHPSSENPYQIDYGY